MSGILKQQQQLKQKIVPNRNKIKQKLKKRTLISKNHSFGRKSVKKINEIN